MTKRIPLLKLLASFFFILSAFLCNAQTIINYSAWTPPALCNQFWDPNGSTREVSVPVTINSAQATILHNTTVGQPRYDNSNTSVNLDCNTTNNSANFGTEYKMLVNFKANYTYKITVNAARIKPTSSDPNPFLRLDMNSGGSGGNGTCTGATTIDATTSGNLKQSLGVTSSTFTDYVFNYSGQGANTYLLIAAVPPNNSPLETILIKKITIEETAPSIAFTITNPINVICGKSNAITLTVTNVNSTPGVTDYTYTLGANNNWLYQGSPAPASITIPSNSLSLSPVCGTTPSNVTATANAGTNHYNTNVGTVSSILETLSIIGTSTICPGSGSFTYSIQNLPSCGASVTSWTASPTGIVQITNNGNTASISRISDGQVTLTAVVTYTNSCYTGSRNVTFPLSSGAVPLTGYYTISSGYNQPGNNTLGTNNAAIFVPANQTFGVTAYITNTNITGASWTRNTGSYPFTWSSTGIQLNFNGSAGNVAYTTRNGKFDLTANTGCGVTTTTFTWPVIPTSNGRMSTTPNPVKDNLHITFSSSLIKGTLERSQPYILISLYNATTSIPVKSWQFKNNQNSFDLNLTGVKKGQYVLKVLKDNVQESRQITIE